MQCIWGSGVKMQQMSKGRYSPSRRQQGEWASQKKEEEADRRKEENKKIKKERKKRHAEAEAIESSTPNTCAALSSKSIFSGSDWRIRRLWMLLLKLWRTQNQGDHCFLISIGAAKRLFVSVLSYLEVTFIINHAKVLMQSWNLKLWWQ